MATTKTRTRTPAELDSFDVTCVIGRVELSRDGTMNPHVAAFQLIAQHDTPGHYTFPLPNGDTCHVDVHYASSSDTMNGRDEVAY